MSVESLMGSIVSALPDTSRSGHKTIREVCLSFDQDRWYALAGGHPAVHIGEWGGDFEGEGETAEIALTACLESIRRLGQ
jgi:hypothetical protein